MKNKQNFFLRIVTSKIFAKYFPLGIFFLGAIFSDSSYELSGAICGVSFILWVFHLAISK